MNLNNLQCGENAEIIKIEGPHRLKLSEFGFNPGTTIKMICKGCAGGPIKVSVRESDYALRVSEAKCVKIKKIAQKEQSINDNIYWWYKDL